MESKGNEAPGNSYKTKLKEACSAICVMNMAKEWHAEYIKNSHKPKGKIFLSAEKAALCSHERGSSLEANHAGTLILNFPASISSRE